MTLRGQISRRIIEYDTVPGAWGLDAERFLPGVRGWPSVAAGTDGVAFYEVVCRGPSKCGTFVSVRPLDACPKCGSSRIQRRAGEPALKTKS